jgi:putative endonuclease
MAKVGYVYILASMTRGTLYVGVTSDLPGRIWEHRNGVKSGFASRYGVVRLVHFEIFDDISDAIAREKALKKWRRKWKVELVEQDNPDWRELYPQVLG